MRMKSILVLVLATLMLFACSKEDNNPEFSDGDKSSAAYIYLKVTTEIRTYASGKDNGDTNKSILSGSSYTYNFYTKDPNFTGTVGMSPELKFIYTQ